MAFAPAQNHEVELSISLIHQVPGVPAKHHKSLLHRGVKVNAAFVPFYWFTKQQNVPRNSRGRVSAASRGAKTELISEYLQGNVIPIRHSKYDPLSRPEKPGSLTPFLFFYKIFFIYKVQHVTWLWRDCISKHSGGCFGAWTVAP